MSTRVDATSSGDTTATAADHWVTTFQNYSGSTSSDPRLGHVLSGVGGSIGLTDAHFADGDDNPYWSYDVTVPAGETRIVMTFVTGQPSRAAAQAQAARLATLPASTLECLSAAEQTEVVNFAVAPDLSIVKTGASTLLAGQPAISA